jgi:polyisoprenoid-binding protein YceI
VRAAFWYVALSATLNATLTATLFAALTNTVPVRAAHAQSPPWTLEQATLWFDGKGTFGAFRGITHTATGTMRGSPAALNSVRGYVESPAASLSTDNRLRDRDMRNTLDVERYPVIRFDLDSVTVRMQARDSASVELIGRLTVHGVSRVERIPAAVTWSSSERVQVRGAFDLSLPSYRITSLKRFFGALVMEEIIQVGLEVTFRAPAGYLK